MSNQTATALGPSTIPWSRRLLPFVVLLALLVIAEAVWKLAAAPAEQPKITLQARGSSIETVLRDVASQSGAVLALDPRMTGKISLETKNARLADFMNDFCTAYSCTWKLSGGSKPALVVRKSQPAAPSALSKR
jgi:type II secretory pathway component GspD/PulD (secretin)